MAFSTSVTGARYMGPGSMQIVGTWTGNAGDAAGLMTVSGSVNAVIFQKFDALDNTYQTLPRVETSFNTGTNLTTITVENQDNVSSGRFIIDKTGL